MTVNESAPEPDDLTRPFVERANAGTWLRLLDQPEIGPPVQR